MHVYSFYLMSDIGTYIKIGEENSYYFECCDKHSPKDIVYVYFLLT